MALCLALKLRDIYVRFAGALLLMSPMVDPRLSGTSMSSRKKQDPMISRGWLEQGLRWYAGELMEQPLQVSLKGLPPMVVQVGDDELLLSDSTRLGEHAICSGVDCRVEIYMTRWHVFQLQAFYLRSAANALQAISSLRGGGCLAQESSNENLRVQRMRCGYHRRYRRSWVGHGQGDSSQRCPDRVA
ncbi:alpha/beta hydrolase [Pseudomonas californiensis]|uniref:alpha/beta hydrolase n=1 Tax=Pseudomonas californiensis TaxID=2829823 RepID=UPI002228715E